MLHRLGEAENMARYYVLSIEPSLFGDTALVREWGRIGQRGKRRIDLFADNPQAAVALNTWLDRMTKRGYAHRGSRPISPDE